MSDCEGSYEAASDNFFQLCRQFYLCVIITLQKYRVFLDAFFVAVVTFYVTLMSAVIGVLNGTITLPLSEAVW